MDSAKVMVLDAGKIVEYDSPKNLLNKKKYPQGVFASFVAQTGAAMSKRLHEIASGKLELSKALELESSRLLSESKERKMSNSSDVLVRSDFK